MRTTVLVSLLLAAAQLSVAAPAPPAVRAEIAALLDRLQSSGCTFNRNGSWYPGSEAQAHLQRKLQYLEDRNAVSSTEQFIERGASTSSISGKPYLVKCGSAAPVESRIWLGTELKALRSSGKPPPQR
jgi:hypothetical protein